MKAVIALAICGLACTLSIGQELRPNIVLVMADDQGWGQTSYNGHPTLKTPNLDAMAESGIRFDRFYAAGPVCSPTRASVLTGRTPNRTGVPSHGHNLCLQEKTLPQALKDAGYATGHFGKWHLNGIRGPGVPILGDDANHPGRYGFDEWLSVTNFFEVNPLMSRLGKFEEFEGDSSDIVIVEALNFMAHRTDAGVPFFAVVWYGSPHSPWIALDEDVVETDDERLSNHLGEIAALDRSIGTLRHGLRALGIEEDTLVWYCSDNGGLTVDPDSCGNLRANKGSVFEGGIRVPGIVEWPGHIEPAVTDNPASTMDIMPTLVELLELPQECQMDPMDGESLLSLLHGKTAERQKPIPFLFQKQAALIDGNFKLVSRNINQDDNWLLFDLSKDQSETTNLADAMPDRLERMKIEMGRAIESIEASAAGADYPEGEVVQTPRREFWAAMEAYQPHFEMLFKRPEYSGQRNKVPEALKLDHSGNELQR